MARIVPPKASNAKSPEYAAEPTFLTRGIYLTKPQSTQVGRCGRGLNITFGAPSVGRALKLTTAKLKMGTNYERKPEIKTAGKHQTQS